jgi:hypothetical protein
MTTDLFGKHCLRCCKIHSNVHGKQRGIDCNARYIFHRSPAKASCMKGFLPHRLSPTAVALFIRGVIALVRRDDGGASAPCAFMCTRRRRRRSRWLVNFVSLVYNWCQTVFTVLYSALRADATG